MARQSASNLAGPAHNQLDLALVTRLARSAIVLEPSTIMSFHRTLVRRKFRLLFTPKPILRLPANRTPATARLDVELDKDVVRRVLAKHYWPDPSHRGPSWLTSLAHTEDSPWSLDFFRCESLILKTHWLMVVMEQYTRRFVGFAVHAGAVDGPAICRKFGRIVALAGTNPKSISSDHDPLFGFRRWKANLRILEIQEIKTVPDVPLSHSFVEH